MIGCCLTPSEHFVSNIIARTSYFWWDAWLYLFCCRQTNGKTIYM